SVNPYQDGSLSKPIRHALTPSSPYLTDFHITGKYPDTSQIIENVCRSVAQPISQNIAQQVRLPK
ncbi:hypothetical protein, partial [Vibrio splendidus]|uniref:hypothetical protein n=1 Tax=Vibrio splendidus TaxID=29497 RepID=UPI0019D6C478